MLVDPATTQAAIQVLNPAVQWVIGASAGVVGTCQAVSFFLKLRNGNGKTNGKPKCKDAPENVECRMSISGIAEDQKGVNKFINDTNLVWEKHNTLFRDLLKETRKSNQLLGAIAGNGKSKG